MMNRRAFASALIAGTSCLAGLSVFGATTVLAGPGDHMSAHTIGKWDEPVRLFWPKRQNEMNLTGIGWTALFHGKEYGEVMQLTTPITLNEMISVVTRCQTRSDEVLMELIGGQA